jgi:ribosomal protein S18 acetylase RimI-like enzyme
VRPDRRGEGLGLALLRHTFVEFHALGRRRVSLHVDVDNLTGAVRLYTKAGMRSDPRLVVWERR